MGRRFLTTGAGLLQPGEFLDERFQVDRLAGRGGMGEVYRALDVQTREPVALKVLRRRDPEDAERLAREAWLLSELRHPGIVRYIAHGAAEDGLSYLAMEWLEGEK